MPHRPFCPSQPVTQGWWFEAPGEGAALTPFPHPRGGNPRLKEVEQHVPPLPTSPLFPRLVSHRVSNKTMGAVREGGWAGGSGSGRYLLPLATPKFELSRAQSEAVLFRAAVFKAPPPLSFSIALSFAKVHSRILYYSLKLISIEHLQRPTTFADEPTSI